MKRSSWKTYAVWILLPELVGALSGWLTRNDTQVYEESIRQPPLSPPRARSEFVAIDTQVIAFNRTERT